MPKYLRGFIVFIAVMAYKGRYRVKNRDKYTGDVNDVIYRSLWERQCFRWADHSSFVKKWSSESVVVPYFYEADESWHRYFVDLYVEFSNGKILLIEIKPLKETRAPEGDNPRNPKLIKEALTYIKNMNKWEAARKLAKKKGWEFVVWTEVELTQMGILPKSTKPLKRGGFSPLTPVPQMKTRKNFKPYPPMPDKRKPE
jgi:hypothetical protein